MLCLFGGLLEPLERNPVRAEVDSLGRFELVDQPPDDTLVEVVPAEMRIAVGRFNLENAVADLENRDVEGAAAQVKDRDRLVLALLPEAVRQRRRGRLVDDPQHLEARDLPSILRRLALGVVEIGRHRNNRLSHRLAKERFRVRLQLLQDHGRYFLRSIVAPTHQNARVAVGCGDHPVRDVNPILRHGLIVELTAHKALDREDRILGIGYRLALRDLADRPLTALRDGDN